jgi:hypothetical protein
MKVQQTVRYVDVFNGDADGLCALHQLRLAEPRDARLVTGLKRDIDLLARVDGDAGTQITVLDISLDRNRPALIRLLQQGAQVLYFDHHFAGELPVHPRLEVHIDFSPGVCTSLLVDRFLHGRERRWAIVGAYGDNLHEAAATLAAGAGVAQSERTALQRIGAALNYNSYGDVESDVLIHPLDLYRRLQRYAEPLEFLANEPLVDQLLARCEDDLAHAQRVAPRFANAECAVIELPDAPWSRRVLGTLANRLAHGAPERAHALLKPTDGSAYHVSVRAPLVSPYGAADLVRRFAGGGRAGAAGIEALPASRLDAFIEAFKTARWGRPVSPV